MEVLERPLAPLRMDDLATKCGSKGKDVMKQFRAGHAQLLPFRDRFGRRVLFVHNEAIAFEDVIKVSHVSIAANLLEMQIWFHSH